MADKPEIMGILKKIDAESERIRQTAAGRMFLNICMIGAQSLNVLRSIDKRLSNIEARLEGSDFAINRYIKSDAVIKVEQTKTINSDAEIE